LGKDSTSRLLSEATHCTVPTAAVFDFRDTNQAGFDGMAVFEESPFSVFAKSWHLASVGGTLHSFVMKSTNLCLLSLSRFFFF
jgi:hypothetical protein